MSNRAQRLIRAGLFAAAIAGSVLLIVADFSTLRGVRAITAQLATVTAGGEHDHALLIVGVLALPISVWAAIGRSRLASLALVLAGAASAVVIIAVDAPSVGQVAPYDQLFASVTATRGDAIYLEIVGAGLLLLSGAGLLLIGRQPDRAAVRDRRRSERPRAAAPGG